MTGDKSRRETRVYALHRVGPSQCLSPRRNMSNAQVTYHGKKVRITLDIAESLVRDIDRIRERIGVDRGALIKVWLHEKVQEEKTS